MKVEVRKLREVMGLLMPVIPRKPRYQMLNHILLKDGKAMATDLQITVILEFPEVQEEVLIHKDTLDFLRFIPGDTIADISEGVDQNEKRTLTIACGSSRRTFPFSDPADYPPLPSEPDMQVHLDGDRLLEALAMAASYACRDESRPVLSGVTLALGESRSFVASGDGYRMFIKEMPGTSDASIRVVIPTPAVAIMKDLWKTTARADDPAVDALLTQVALARRFISLGFTDESAEPHQRYMSAHFGGVRVISRLIAGVPPNWKDLIPKDPQQRVKVFAQDLCRAVTQVRDVSLAAQGAVRLSWSENTVKVLARADDQVAEAEAFATIEGGEGGIAFSIRYLLEYLKERQGLVQMGFISPQSPGLFLDGRCTVVMMPMFLKDVTPEEPEDTTEDSVGDKGEPEIDSGEGNTGEDSVRDVPQPKDGEEAQEVVTAGKTSRKPGKPKKSKE